MLYVLCSGEIWMLLFIVVAAMVVDVVTDVFSSNS